LGIRRADCLHFHTRQTLLLLNHSQTSHQISFHYPSTPPFYILVVPALLSSSISHSLHLLFTKIFVVCQTSPSSAIRAHQPNSSLNATMLMVYYYNEFKPAPSKN